MRGKMLYINADMWYLIIQMQIYVQCEALEIAPFYFCMNLDKIRPIVTVFGPRMPK